jgi:hypothetical protein
MPLWVAAIIGALVQACGTLVGRVLVSLGFGYTIYTGIDTSIVWARDAFFAGLTGIGGTAVQVAGALKLGVAVSIITSALAARMLLNGLTGGAIRKLTLKD